MSNMALFSPVSDLPMAEVVQAARQELVQYQRRQATADCYRYELFRRAMVLRDEWAWSALYELYRPLVSAWVLASRSRATGEEVDALVNEAFARFARAITAQQWHEFGTSGALLGYLKRCAHSAAADDRRTRHPRLHEEPLDTLPVSCEPLSEECAEVVSGRLAAQELWAIICRAASSPAEQVVLRLVCAQGLPPRVVQQLHPTLFPGVQDLYRVKRTVLERLSRSKELRQFQQSWLREGRA